MPASPQDSSQTVLITGGGTGGHLYPALAVAEEIRRQRPDLILRFFGRDSEKERKEVESRGIEFVGLPLQGLRRRITIQNIKALYLTMTGFARCYRLMRRLPRGVVFGVGGYVSAPAMLAGKSLGWKMALHEQNTIPGLVNRFIARWCDAVYVTYERSSDFFQGVSVMMTGLPVRLDLRESREITSRVNQETLSILVIGGSQGAKKVVEHSLAAFARLFNKQVKFRALVQTGENNFHWAQSLLRSGNVTLTPFIFNMANAYNHADLIISRAGSSSLSEIAMWGLPSILIPYPFASENHQKLNAEEFSNVKAAIVLEEKDLTPEILANWIEEMIRNPERRLSMGRNARGLARDDAAEMIANGLIELLEEKE